MNINDAITTYIIESARASAAKKAADAAKKFILSAAGNDDSIESDDYVVYVNRSESFRLDTSALYRDFPDIKETYGKITMSVSIEPHEKPDAEKKTA